MPHCEQEETNLNLESACTVFDEIEDQYICEQDKAITEGPIIMNAFEMITLSKGLDLSALFERRQVQLK